MGSKNSSQGKQQQQQGQDQGEQQQEEEPFFQRELSMTQAMLPADVMGLVAEFAVPSTVWSLRATSAIIRAQIFEACEELWVPILSIVGDSECHVFKYFWAQHRILNCGKTNIPTLKEKFQIPMKKMYDPVEAFYDNTRSGLSPKKFFETIALMLYETPDFWMNGSGDGSASGERWAAIVKEREEHRAKSGGKVSKLALAVQKYQDELVTNHRHVFASGFLVGDIAPVRAAFGERLYYQHDATFIAAFEPEADNHWHRGPKANPKKKGDNEEEELYPALEDEVNNLKKMPVALGKSPGSGSAAPDYMDKNIRTERYHGYQAGSEKLRQKIGEQAHRIALRHYLRFGGPSSCTLGTFAEMKSLVGFPSFEDTVKGYIPSSSDPSEQKGVHEPEESSECQEPPECRKVPAIEDCQQLLIQDQPSLQDLLSVGMANDLDDEDVVDMDAVMHIDDRPNLTSSTTTAASSHIAAANGATADGFVKPCPVFHKFLSKKIQQGLAPLEPPRGPRGKLPDPLPTKASLLLSQVVTKDDGGWSGRVFSAETVSSWDAATWRQNLQAPFKVAPPVEGSSVDHVEPGATFQLEHEIPSVKVGSHPVSGEPLRLAGTAITGLLEGEFDEAEMYGYGGPRDENEKEMVSYAIDQEVIFNHRFHPELLEAQRPGAPTEIDQFPGQTSGGAGTNAQTKKSFQAQFWNPAPYLHETNSTLYKQVVQGMKTSPHCSPGGRVAPAALPLEAPWLILGSKGSWCAEHKEPDESYTWAHLLKISRDGPNPGAARGGARKTWFVEKTETSEWVALDQHEGETVFLPPTVRHFVVNPDCGTCLVSRNFHLVVVED